jgi:predicted CopG family antitoxin
MADRNQRNLIMDDHAYELLQKYKRLTGKSASELVRTLVYNVRTKKDLYPKTAPAIDPALQAALDLMTELESGHGDNGS